MQQLCKSCGNCFMFYRIFYFTCDRSLIQATDYNPIAIIIIRIIIMTRSRLWSVAKTLRDVTFLGVLPHLSPTGCLSLADLLYQCPPGTSRRSSPVSTRTTTSLHCNNLFQCLVGWCGGFQSNDMTEQRVTSCRLVIMSPMFGRLVISAMSVFFT